MSFGPLIELIQIDCSQIFIIIKFKYPLIISENPQEKMQRRYQIPKKFLFVCHANTFLKSRSSQPLKSNVKLRRLLNIERTHPVSVYPVTVSGS